MKRAIGWLMAGLVVVMAGSYTWTRRHHVVAAVAVQGDSVAPIHEELIPDYEEARQARELVTVTGPLADYMSRQKPSHIETLQPISRRPTAADHVGGSPVGTSSEILQKAFRVIKVVNVPFEVPAHASNPQIRGTYRSFVEHDGPQIGDTGGDVEFLVLNEQQYGDFLSGHSSEATFSAVGAQEVSASLPPTLSEPAKYHLVFLNNRHDRTRQLVQADFRIDF
jgi:hypothetical protein